MTEALGDFFGGGEGSGAPAVSWAEARAKEGFRGVVCPSQGDPDKGHETIQGSEKDTGLPQYWNPDKSSKQKKITDPSTNGVPNKPVKQAVIILQTPLTNWEFTSASFRAKAEEDKDRADDGVRKLYIGGGPLATELNKALKANGIQAPPIGASFAMEVTRRVPNDYGSTTPEIKFSYLPPSPESKKIVDAYIERTKVAATEGSDSFFGGNDSEPPF